MEPKAAKLYLDKLREHEDKINSYPINLSDDIDIKEHIAALNDVNDRAPETREVYLVDQYGTLIDTVTVYHRRTARKASESLNVPYYYHWRSFIKDYASQQYREFRDRLFDVPPGLILTDDNYAVMMSKKIENDGYGNFILYLHTGTWLIYRNSLETQSVTTSPNMDNDYVDRLSRQLYINGNGTLNRVAIDQKINVLVYKLATEFISNSDRITFRRKMREFSKHINLKLNDKVIKYIMQSDYFEAVMNNIAEQVMRKAGLGLEDVVRLLYDRMREEKTTFQEVLEGSKLFMTMHGVPTVPEQLIPPDRSRMSVNFYEGDTKKLGVGAPSNGTLRQLPEAEIDNLEQEN